MARFTQQEDRRGARRRGAAVPGRYGRSEELRRGPRAGASESRRDGAGGTGSRDARPGDDAAKASTALGDSVERNVRLRLQARSPSLVMAAVGTDAVSGYVKGLIGGLPLVARAARSIMAPFGSSTVLAGASFGQRPSTSAATHGAMLRALTVSFHASPPAPAPRQA